MVILRYICLVEFDSMSKGSGFINFYLGAVIFFIGLWVVYYVIRSAIDGSHTAQDIREIRKILSKQFPITDDSEKLMSENKEENDEIEYEPIGECPVNECPGCHSNISSTDRICPSCGLTLKSDIDNI